MISFPLFTQIIKSNVKFWIAFTAILCVFLTVMCNVFTPQTIQSMGGVMQGSIASHFLSGTTLIGFMSNSFYALMAIIFPMFYTIMVGNRLIADKVDHGDMACLLSTPTTRLQIVVTSAFYFILSLAFMWMVASIVGLIAAQVFQPDALDIDIFLRLNIGCFLYHVALSSITFFFSCIFNLSKHSLTFGGGIPVLCFVISLFIKLSEDLDFLKYFTLNTLFDTQKILNDDGYISGFLILGGIAIVLYTIGCTVFCKKDLPL